MRRSAGAAASKTREAYARIHGECAERGVSVDRYGICLDWSMGLPRDQRNDAMRGTGLILATPEDFAALTAAAPVAPHFGDFVLGFPAAVENASAALAAGATSIGNLGQYFTFRLQGASDDIACTSATVEALALIAAQPVEVLVHSNLDDGFAALFQDLGSVMGAVLLERHIGALIGVTVSHCWGHHFSDPVRRLAFHLALAEVAGDTPGTMIYGNTTSYRGTPAENYAALSSYLRIDIAGQRLAPTGHAVNPVPVTENQRIPDVDEVIEAQLFAARLASARGPAPAPAGPRPCTRPGSADRGKGGYAFFDRAIAGLTQAGIDTNDPFQMLLAMRRIGGRQLEAAFGAKHDATRSDIAEEVAEMAHTHLARVSAAHRTALAKAGPAHRHRHHGRARTRQAGARRGAVPRRGRDHRRRHLRRAACAGRASPARARRRHRAVDLQRHSLELLQRLARTCWQIDSGSDRRPPEPDSGHLQHLAAG
jgi:hypothetical protein